MWLLSIDDFVLADYGIPAAMLTNKSSHLGFGVDRRAGVNTSVFFGAQSQPARWHVIIECPTEAARQALIAVLAAPRNDQVYLVADRALPASPDDLVTTWGAITSVVPHGSSDTLEVIFESNDSVWLAKTTTTTSKAFTSSLDQIVHIPVTGNVPTYPIIRLTPTAQRTAFTANVGWRYRQRWTITNNGDEALFRYPVRLTLGSTTALVSGSKALANGNDFRVWLDGVEQARTLVTWNTGASYVWLVMPSLAAGDSLTYDLVYGNPSAGAPPVLAYPDLPAFDLAASTNADWVYRTRVTGEYPGQGLWYLSASDGAYFADFSVPGAWYRLLAFGETSAATEQPAATDDVPGILGARFHTIRAGGADVELEGIDPKDVYDTVALTHPLGIRTIIVGFTYLAWTYTVETETVTTTVGDTSTSSDVDVKTYHDPNMFRVVIGARDTAAETWAAIASFDHSTEVPSVPAAWAETQAGLGVGYIGGNDYYTNPNQIVINAAGDRLYIADTGLNRVIIKNPLTNAHVGIISGIAGVTGVCVDAIGNVYATKVNSGSNFEVLKYGPTFTLLLTTGGITGTPAHLATDGTTLFVVVGTTNEVRRYKCADMLAAAAPVAFGTTGVANGQFQTPVGAAYHSGRLYIVDQVNDRVQVFTPEGAFITSWGLPGSAPGQFLTAVGVGVNPVNGHVFVSDQGRDDIQEFTTYGAYLGEFGTSGTGDPNFDTPTGVAVSGDGTSVWIADQNPDWLRRWTVPLGTEEVEFLYNTIASTEYSILAKQVALGVWPQPRDLMPTPDPQGYVDARSEGDITVGIESGYLPIVTTQAEIAIYELATEVRVGGGGVTPAGVYTALLIGNARGQSGAGTPRAAIPLTGSGLQIDCEAHQHTVWTTGFTQKTEVIPTHAVQAVAGYVHDGVTGEIATTQWLPLAPPRRIVPNGDFAANITLWSLLGAGVGITQTTIWDGTVGGVTNGSLRIGITANTGTEDVTYITSGYFAVNGAESVAVTAWVRTSNAGIQPKLFLVWYQEVSATAVGVSATPAWVSAPVANAEYEIAVSGPVPAGATRFRIGLLADVVTSSATGNIWFDDVRLNDSDLVIEDASMGQITVDAIVTPRWIP